MILILVVLKTVHAYWLDIFILVTISLTAIHLKEIKAQMIWRGEEDEAMGGGVRRMKLWVEG